jgi:outer membrane lipoprotein SlyB
MKPNQAMALTLVAAAALAGGCASTPSPVGSTQYNQPVSSSMQYGVVDSIQTVQAAAGQSSGLGAVAGGVVGGVLGNQVGGGSGRTAATAAGIVGGALAGNEIEKSRSANTRSAYQIGIRLQGGGYQTVTQDTTADLRVGDRVRIENGRAYRY